MLVGLCVAYLLNSINVYIAVYSTYIIPIEQKLHNTNKVARSRKFLVQSLINAAVRDNAMENDIYLFFHRLCILHDTSYIVSSDFVFTCLCTLEYF